MAIWLKSAQKRTLDAAATPRLLAESAYQILLVILPHPHLAEQITNRHLTQANEELPVALSLEGRQGENAG